MIALQLGGGGEVIDDGAGFCCEGEGVGLRHEGEDAVLLRFVRYDRHLLGIRIGGETNALFADDRVAGCDHHGLSELQSDGVDDAVTGVDHGAVS